MKSFLFSISTETNNNQHASGNSCQGFQTMLGIWISATYKLSKDAKIIMLNFINQQEDRVDPE